MRSLSNESSHDRAKQMLAMIVDKRNAKDKTVKVAVKPLSGGGKGANTVVLPKKGRSGSKS